MPLKLLVEAGGEYLLPFAKKTLHVLKGEMARLGLTFRNKVILTGADERIYVESHRVMGAVSLDTIRINAGTPWHFYLMTADTETVSTSRSAAEIAADPVLLEAFAVSLGVTTAILISAALFLGISMEALIILLGGGGGVVRNRLRIGRVGKAIRTVVTTNATSYSKNAVRSLDRPHILASPPGTPWEVVGPTGSVDRVRNGDLDAYTETPTFSVSAGSWGAFFPAGPGVDAVRGVLASSSLVLEVPAREEPSTSFLQFFSTKNDYVLVRSSSVPGEHIEVYSLAQQGRVMNVLQPVDSGYLHVDARATLHDVLFPVFGAITGSIGSAYGGRFDAVTPIYSTVLGAPVGSVGYYFLSSPTLIVNSLATSNDTDFFLAGIRGLAAPDGTPGSAVDLEFNQFIFAFGKARSVLSDTGALLSYDVTDSEYVLIAGSIGDEGGKFKSPGPKPLKDGAWLPFSLQNNAGGIAGGGAFDYQYWFLKDDGSSFSFTSSVPHADPFLTDTTARYGATGNMPWMIVRTGTPGLPSTGTLQFWNMTGLVFESASLHLTADPVIVGCTADTVYAKWVDGSSTYLMGSDGTSFRLQDYLPTFTSGGAISAFYTARDTIYCLGNGVVAGEHYLFHITNLMGTPLAPQVFRYTIDGVSPTIVTAPAVPADSDLARMQELERWS